jgi:Phage portal protein, SPP1 Gp6-like
VLNAKDALEQAQKLYGYHQAEREKLDIIRRYYKGVQARPAAIPEGGPAEVRVMLRSSRVNVMPIVVNTLVQATFVDGFRAREESQDSQVWAAWQRNRMDSRQTAIHRAAFQYGAAYAVVLPGDTAPVVKGASPRSLLAMYGEDPDWPMWALERLGNGLYRLFDDEAAYYVQLGGETTGRRDLYISTEVHDVGVGGAPVVRYLEEDDLDADDEVEPKNYALGEESPPLRGQVQPLMALQDQIDLTTFGLQIAQHYGAFRQRYIIGWTADSERATARAAASKLWTFDDDPESVKVGEFEQTNLDGYIRSREATLRHVASLSQTPVHELIGELVNLSAEALAAAEAGHDRKVGERKTLLGEAHEQTLGLCARIMGVDVPDDAQVKWRDTSARAFAATVDGLGKLATMLGVPASELWERIPGFTQQDVERCRAAAEAADSFAQLSRILERQAA